MKEQHVQDLEIKISFLERHVEELDKALVEVHEKLRQLSEKLERLMAQQKLGHGPGGDESAEDAVPPHY